MNIEQAEATMRGFGKFLEVANGPLTFLFRSAVPESLLPYPKSTITEALTVTQEYFRQQGMTEQENNLGSQIGLLEAWYTDDQSALDQLTKHLEDPAFRKHIISTFGSTQQRQYKNLIEQINN